MAAALRNVVVLLVLAAPLFISNLAEAAISCNQVYNSVSPCISYVAGYGALTPDCCNGIRALNNAARTTPDRQGVCRCLKSAMNGISYTGNNLRIAAGLPARCGVNLPYQISPSINCDTVR